MFQTFIRLLFFLGVSAAYVVSAQPCADTQPSIAGPQVVTNNQLGVVYSTPSIPGHTYSWTVIGGSITSGAGTSQITVTWGAVGNGTVSVQETNTALSCSTTVNKAVAIQPLLVSYFYYTNTSCYGDSVCFHDMSIADPANPIVSYFWTFGDGGTSTLQSPCHVYLPPWNTTYTIRLIVTNFGGFKDTIYDAVAVYPFQFVPTVSYSYDIPNCGYDPVLFNSSASTTPVGTVLIHYDWDFDDPGSGVNNTSLLANPTHIFTSPAPYEVRLIITNDKYCKDTLVQTIVIDPSIPTAKFSFSSPTCLNNPVVFTDLSTSPAGKNLTRWEWNFGDGSAHTIIFSPGNPSTSHVFPGLGPYRVQLNVINSSGCKDSTFKFVSLDPSPIANFTSVGQCLGDSTLFTDHSLVNNGPPITAWSWDFGDPNSGYPTSSLKDPAHLFSTTGTFTVTLVSFNSSGCPDTMQKQVTIFPKPDVEYTWAIGSQNNEIHFHIDSTITNLLKIGNMCLWNFGDGTYGFGHNPVHIYPAAGSFDVTLSVTDTIGCSNFITHTVTVPAIPFAFFGTDSPQCFGQPICFTDLSSVPSPPFGFISQWVWNFGDGSPNDTIHFPNNPNVCHTYATVDTFLVTLTVWDNWGYQDDFSANVIIKPNPIANFQYTVPCQDQVVSFTDASFPNGGGNIISWDWNFGDSGSGINNVSGLQNPTHTFSLCGWYDVRLIVRNFNNCVDTVIKQVYVHCSPFAAYNYDTACFNQVTHFWADQTIMQIDSIVLWTWDFGDGSLVNHDPVMTSHLYGTLGTFVATLTVVDHHGCSKTVSHIIRVNPLPVSQFTWSTPTCQNAYVQFTDQSYIPAGYPGYVARWQWNFDDGTAPLNIFLPNSPSILYKFADGSLNHLVTLKVWSGDSCVDSIQHLVNSTPAPIANFQFSSTPCSNQPVQFTDLSQLNGGGIIASWEWNFDDPASGSNNLSNLQNPQHSFLSSGSFLVRLVVTNVNACTDTVWKTVDVNLLPVANFSADTACLNNPTHFTSTSIPNATSILIYNWEFGDGQTSPQQNPSHTYPASGLYWVHLTVTNSNGCIHDTLKQVLVNPLPIPAFSFTTPNCVGAQVCYTDMSTLPTGFLGYIQTWLWDFGDGTTATIQYPSNPDTCHVFVGFALFHPVTLTVTTNTGCIQSMTQQVTSVPSPLANFSFPTFPNTPCAQQQVQFTDQSQPNGGGSIITWWWDFGDVGSGGNNNSSTQNPVHLFSGSGSFTVTLIVTNASNCTDTIAKTIVINDLPVANFSSDTVCLGTMTTFTNLSTTGSGSIVAYFWEFGDGFTSGSPDPTHLYAAAQVYNVKLTVTTNAGCVKDTTKQVIVLPTPVASFSFTAPTCAGDSVHFNDLSSTAHGSIVTWYWQFGDGGSTTVNFPGNPNVYHLYLTGGTFNVTLTITTSDGCQKSTTQQVLIQNKPLANFDYSPVRCQNMPVQFTDLSQPNGGSAITTWAWNFGESSSGSANNSTVKNPTHTYSGFGNYQVTLTIYNATGCHDTISKTVSVSQAPQAIFSADTACVNNLTHFTDASVANGGSVTSWYWDFGEPSSGTSNNSTLQNPTHSYGGPGTFTVTLVVTNTNTCEDDTSMQIVVNPKPAAMFSYSAACVGDSTQFTDLSIAPGSQVIAWLWNFDDGGTSTVQNPAHTFAAAGTYNVSLVVTNLANCIDSIVIPVVARPTPIAAFTYQNYFCPAGKVDFQDQSQGVAAAIVEHLWIFEPGYTSNLINPTHTFSVTDTTYVVTLIVTDNFGCKDTIADSVFVKPGFSFDFAFDSACYLKPTHFTHINLAQGDSLYSPYWEFGDPASGQNNYSHLYDPVHFFTHAGIFTVKFRAYNSDNCADSIYRTVLVYEIPTTNFTWISLPCDSVIHFADSSSTGSGVIASWEWSFGDGTPPLLINPPETGDTSHMYGTIGQFPVRLIITNSNGCVDSVFKMVERFPCIKAGFKHIDSLLCARYQVSFADTSLPDDPTTIDQWHWTFGDGLDTTYTTRAATVNHVYANGGTYIVTLFIHATVNGKGFADSVKQVITIHATPLTYFSNAAVCLNRLTLFRDTSSTFGENITSWNWNFGEPTSGVLDTSTFRNPSHQYGAGGTYDVKLIVMNQWGCKDSLTKTTRVFNLPVAHFTTDTICRNVPIVFYDQSENGDTLINSWRWNFGVLTTKTDTAWVQDPVYRYRTEGAYTVRLVIQDRNLCLDTIDSLVTVNPTPVAAFTITDNLEGMIGKILLNNQSTGASIYFWNFGNGESSMEENPTVTYKNDGTYTIRLITANQYNCYDTTYYKYEVLFKGLWVPNAFSPTNTNIAVRLFKPVGINIKQYHAMVFDNWGHLMWESTLLDSQGRPVEGWDGTFNGNLQPQGTYMWKITALFIDNTEWQGSDIGKGEAKTMGAVTLIR